MKAVKILSGMSLFIFSISAQAGFFGQSDDFKCGREDAIKAVQNTLRETASATLQTEFITSPALFSQPQGSYLNILESIPIDISNISTIGSKDSIASCTATVSIKFPEETLAVVAIAPKFFNQLVNRDNAFNKGGVVWKSHTYIIKLADNKKDIIVNGIDDISSVLRNSVWLAASKEKIINDENQERLNKAKQKFDNIDAHLNMIWRDLPDAVRASIKTAEAKWVNEKAIACGNINDANLNTFPIESRIKIFECQAEMTSKRVDFLSHTSN